MNALELFLLGRKLTKLGEAAMPASGFHQAPMSVRAVLVDVFEHPGTTISAIVARTGLPQGQVSAAVARFRDQEVFTTEADAVDRRRTLVRAAPGVLRRGVERTAVPVGETMARALNTDDPAVVDEVIAALDMLADRLIPKARSGARGKVPPDES